MSGWPDGPDGAPASGWPDCALVSAVRGLAATSLQSWPSRVPASAIVSRRSASNAATGAQMRYEAPASAIASRPSSQRLQVARCASSQPASSVRLSWPSARIAMSGSAFSHAFEAGGIVRSAVWRNASRSAIRAREMSCATELRFIPMSTAISS